MDSPNILFQIANQLWDLVNSSNFIHAISRNHLEAGLRKLETFTDFVNSWEFTATQGRARRAALPFHNGWKFTLAAIRGFVVRYMEEQRILDFLFTRRFNQDHV
jgi:hypothetical protein